MARQFFISQHVAYELGTLRAMNSHLSVEDFEAIQALIEYRSFTVQEVPDNTCGAVGPYVPAAETHLICRLTFGHSDLHKCGSATWIRSPKPDGEKIAEMKASLLEVRKLLGE